MSLGFSVFYSIKGGFEYMTDRRNVPHLPERPKERYLFEEETDMQIEKISGMTTEKIIADA
jgi:hypothetical protein